MRHKPSRQPGRRANKNAKLAEVRRCNALLRQKELARRTRVEADIKSLREAGIPFSTMTMGDEVMAVMPCVPCNNGDQP